MGFSANVLKFDKNNIVEDFTFILSTKNYKHIGKINNVKRDTVNCVGNLNSANEISFEVYKTVNGETEEHWDEIVDLKSVFVPELNEYFEIKVTYNDNINAVKKIVGTSLCEAELGQINIYGTEINTEADIGRDNYVETKFYDENNPKASLLHRVLSFAPHYKIKYVDPSLCDIQRSFSIDGTAIYDFLTSECAEQFDCLFTFNSKDRSISVYDLYSTCIECGYRGAFNDICPECGSNHITYFGEDTCIFVNKENLTSDVQFETDIDQMKNCFKLTAGDDIMTTAIINQNPNGTAYMYTVPIEQRADMSEEFLQRFDAYNELYDSYTDEYQQLSENINELKNQIDYYTYTMMPTPVDDDEEETETTISVSEKEAQKLTASKLSPVGLPKLSSSTSVNTVNDAIKNYAKVFVNTSLVKVEVEESTFTYKGMSGGWNYGEWKGKLKVTCWSNKEDVVITEQMTITAHDNYGDYCQQSALKEITQVTDEDSVFDVLGIEDLNAFKSALELYCLNRLTSFKGAIEAAMSSLQGLQQSTEDAEWYDELYLPYYNKLMACADEIEKREATINALTVQLEPLENRKYEIQKELNFEDYLGEELFLEFCSYKREQEYNNSNYISDGLSDSELMAKAREFWDAASKELYKSANRQNRISTSLHNLLVMPEFKELVKKFALGNFIRVQVDKDIYRLRLIHYTINFSDLTKIEIEFSDLTKTANGLNDVQSILSSAQSMAKSYDTVAKQSEKGQVANRSIDEMIKTGLNNALIKIKNNTNEEVTIDNNGITGRSYDDITGEYSPKQYRLTNNLFLFTKNNWRSAELGIGEMTYSLDGKTYEDYGIITKYLVSGKVVAGDIFSADFSSTEGKGTHFDLESGSFTLADSKIVYDSSTNKMTIKGVDIEWSSSTTPEIGDINGLNDTLTTQSASITANANAIATEVTRAKGAEELLSSSITQTADNIILAVEKNLTDNYSTTTQMEAAINLKADSITSTVSETYETKENANSQYNTLSSSITQTANSITSTVSANYETKNNANTKYSSLQSQITQNANNINLKVSASGLIGEINNQVNIGTEAISISGNKFTVDATNFKLAANGYMEAISGKIGGWTIASTYIGNSQTGGSIYITSVDDNSDYWIRTHNAANGGGTRTFSVSKAGKLYATGAEISGKITATEGQIASITIQKDQGLFYSPPNNTTIGFGLWATTAHANIAFHAGANNTNIGGAPFRVYHDGSVTATNLTVTGGNIAGWKINENYLGADDCFIRADGRFTFRYMVNNSTVGSVSFAYNSNTNRCRLHLNNDCDFVIGSVSITEEQLRRLLALL